MRESYLARVNLSYAPKANEAGLFELHRAQAFSIPFENLSVFLGEKVPLGDGELTEKLLHKKRGGYCFELNGLFAAALKEFGFDFQVHLARVQVQNPEPGPLTHQLGVATIANRPWLCDVGFGGPSIRYPMPLELDRVETQDGEAFRLQLNSDFGLGLQQRQADGSWFPLYFFHRTRVQPIDLTMANYFTSTWDQSIFRKGPMCARPFVDGKFTLMGRELKTKRAGAVVAEKLVDSTSFLTALREKFLIELSSEQERKAAVAFEQLP